MTSPPNVLWIMADQLRFDYLSCYDCRQMSQPNSETPVAASTVRLAPRSSLSVCEPLLQRLALKGTPRRAYATRTRACGRRPIPHAMRHERRCPE